MTERTDPLVSPAWLNERLSAPDIRIVDATWFLPHDPRDARSLFAERRIPGAVFFDIDEIADLETPLPHMLPPPEKFASRVMKLGIGDGAHVVAYDAHGVFSAARVWWMFRVMGHEDVSVLDGGFPAWERAGLPIETDPPRARAERHFTPRLRMDLVRGFDDVRQASEKASATIVDARPAARFTGAAPEPREGLARGHIPGSINVPFTNVLEEDGRMASAARLRDLLAHIDASRPLITTCGSGITASVLALAFARMGRWDAAVYDGSWAEWGARADAAKATGA